MKDFYGKTYKNAYFSALGERFIVILQDCYPLIIAFVRRPCFFPAATLLICSFLCFCFESMIPSLIIAGSALIAGIFQFFIDPRKARCDFVSHNKAVSRQSVLVTSLILAFVLAFSGFTISARLNCKRPSDEGPYRCTVTDVSYDLSGDIDITVITGDSSLAKVVFRCDVPMICQGDNLILYGKCKMPENAGNPGEFDYKQYLKTKGVLYIIVCDRCEVLNSPAFPLNISGYLQKLFFDLKKQMFEAVSDTFDDSVRALAAAVCLGDKSLTDDSVKRDFKMSCCSHLLAVSGTHFSGFLACLPALFNAFKIKHKKALVIHIAFCFLIGCLTGWSDSVTRAAFMSICAFAMRDWVSAVCMASIIMVTADPFCPLSSGFQMSFCAVIAIKVFNGKVLSVLMKLHFGEKISGIISPCICAAIGQIPFWSEISMKPDLEHLLIQICGSFLGQTACMFFVPCVVLCMLFPGWSSVLSSPLSFCLDLLLKTVALGSKISERGGITIRLSGTFLIVLGLALFLFVIPPCHVRRVFLKLTALLLAIVTGFEFFSYLDRPCCRVVFADVGQGDCCLIITPESTCLIDGGTYEEGSSTVLDLLDYYGIYEADVCIMSHWDTDHAGGIAALYEAGRTGTILTSYVPLTYTQDEDVNDFFDSIGFMDPQKDSYLSFIEVLASGDRIVLSDKVYIDVLYPFSGSGGGNEDSLVLMLCISGSEEIKVLFTGDIGTDTEALLTGEGIDLDCDILKVAHHGSKYSSSEEFIEASSPSLAVISVGKNNFYGHPAPATLERLDSYGCEVLRTDEEGVVIMEFR